MTQEEYYEAKKEFFSLNRLESRNEAQTKRFYELLRAISEYENKNNMND